MSSVVAIRNESAVIRCIDTCGSVRTCIAQLEDIIRSASAALGITDQESLAGFRKRIEEFESNS